MHIGPVVEKAGNSKEPFILTEPEELIKAGKISNVPLLISHTDTDGMFLAAGEGFCCLSFVSEVIVMPFN